MSWLIKWPHSIPGKPPMYRVYDLEADAMAAWAYLFDQGARPTWEEVTPFVGVLPP